MTQDNKTFTIHQIHEALQKVKSGTDFPQFVQDLKVIGVIHYDTYVADGRTTYYGTNDFVVLGVAKYPLITINSYGSADKLRYSISIHQQGQTDFPTFCTEVANAGVRKWTTNLIEMTVIYFDEHGNKLIEENIQLP